ncbi:hypothetical protein EKG40_08305 [Pseudomonas moorei]|nr:hypothetical protein EKG40_08305 [Pseudomonas moorei]
MNTKLKKQSTFHPYVVSRTAHIEALVGQAISTIDASKYGGITDYCKTLSAIITELRAARAVSPSSPYFNKKVKRFSHVTLLRNETYREMVEKEFNSSRGLEGTLEEQPDEDVEELKFQVVSLSAQLNLMKDRVIAIDAGRGLTSIDNTEAEKIIAKLNQRVDMLIRVNQDVLNSVNGAFKLVLEPTEKQKVAGMYGPRGLVATLEDLDEMKRASKEHPLTL